MKKIWNWLIQKTPEVKDLNLNDVLMAKVVARIKAEKESIQSISLPLYSIKLLHPIDRESALEKVSKREALLRDKRHEVKEKRKLGREYLNEILESVTDINTVDIGDGEYIAWEGNGRLVALRNVFNDGDGIEIEVNNYVLKDGSTIPKEIRKLRAQNRVKNE